MPRPIVDCSNLRHPIDLRGIEQGEPVGGEPDALREGVGRKGFRTRGRIAYPKGLRFSPVLARAGLFFPDGNAILTPGYP